jgi:hypothetical protein
MYDPVRDVRFDLQVEPRVPRRSHVRHEPAPASRHGWIVVAALFVLCALGASQAGAASASPRAQTASSCTPGPTTVGTSPARAFCGPAKATAKVGGRTFTFAHGSCLTAPGFGINVGTLTFDPAARAPYLGILLPLARAGTYTGTQVTASLHVGARRVTLSTTGQSKVVLKPGLRSGTFSGLDLDGRQVKGSFSC